MRASVAVAHRSISPNTMSCVPMIATTSAIMWPRAISSSAARCAKPGARIFRRYGLLAPSRHQVDAELALRVLDRGVGLALGHADSLR